MSFSVVLQRLKVRAKELGLSEESFFLQELHKVAGGGDTDLIDELVAWSNAHGYSETAAVVQNLLNTSTKIRLSASDIRSGYLTISGSDSIIVPIGFLVSEHFLDFIPPSDPNYITCAPDDSDTVSASFTYAPNQDGIAHNMEISWSVAGTRTIKWLVKN